MTPLRILHMLLFATACGWGTSALALKGTMAVDERLPHLMGELQRMSPDRRDETFRGFDEEFAQTSWLERRLKRLWLKQQWVMLSPEQRDLLHRQILEHWQHMTPEQREQIREAHPLNQQKLEPVQGNAGRQEYCPKPLSPEERQEFHQWMRIRQGGSQQ